MNGKKEVSEVLQDFLNYIDQCRAEYQAAREAVELEDKKLQDLLHELEFAKDENEKRRVSTKLQRSRRERRKAKNEKKRMELIVNFFNESEHKRTMNKMRQLLGQQRKEEKFLNGEKVYKPRVGKTNEGEM